MPIEFSVDARQRGRLPRLGDEQAAGREDDREPKRGRCHEARPALPDRTSLGAADGRRAAFAWPSTGPPGRCRSVDVRADGVDVPLAGHALQLPDAAVLEGQARAGRQVAHRRGDEHLARPAAAMMREAMTTVMPATLRPICSTSPTWTPARISMPELGDASRRPPARKRRPWPAHRRSTKKPSPAVSSSRPPARRSAARIERVMEFQQLVPAAVAEFGGVLGRAYDVGHQDRREKALGGQCAHPASGECARPRGRSTRGDPARARTALSACAGTRGRSWTCPGPASAT